MVSDWAKFQMLLWRICSWRSRGERGSLGYALGRDVDGGTEADESEESEESERAILWVWDGGLQRGDEIRRRFLCVVVGQSCTRRWQ